MLRLLAAALVAANLLFFGWSMGWMDGLVGRAAGSEREPERLAKQVNPERVSLWPEGPASAASAAAVVAASAPSSTAVQASAPAPVPASTAATTQLAASAPASAPLVAKAAPAPAPAATPPAGPASSPASAAVPSGPLACLEAGPFGAAELAQATTALRTAVPAASWAQRSSGEWMIYMGPYPDRDWMERKKRELGRIRGGVPQEEVTSPPELARGISLGRFPTKAAADATLAQYALRGIRTARIVSLTEGSTTAYLRIARADPATATSLTALKLPPRGSRFTPCPR